MSLVGAVNALPMEWRPHRAVLAILKRDSASVARHELPLTTSEYYIYMVTSILLVLLGGVFAGLTLGLMGQDEVYLKVIAASGTPKEKKAAKKVLDLIGNGKHWVLVTLLLSNVITNESLPVILDRFLGGGLVAVFSSTVSIVIFGEIIPQSICVRYGLELGAFFAPYVLALMYLMYPVAYPIAMLLDWILGQDHGTFYKKSGLKTLVNLHHTMGVERLNQDEVTIISSVLDLKAKPVREIMTPINKVFTLPSDQILNEKMVEIIFNAGYSRIPIHLPGEPHNFVGMLLEYTPRTLPETAKDTSCLNILNYFQEGKSHMVVVSLTPGGDTGAIGVVTLEDVIEELIGEEIVDESDVYIDENKTIMRTIPGPLGKRNVTSYLHELYKNSHVNNTNRSPSNNLGETDSINSGNRQAYIKKSTLSRSNSGNNSVNYLPVNQSPDTNNIKPVHVMKPSNLAVDPLATSNTHITIKKQPQLGQPQSPRHSAPLNDDPIVPCNTNEMSTLMSPNFEPRVNSYGSTPEPSLGQPQLHKVHQNEASAFVHGLMDNVHRGDMKASHGELNQMDSILQAKAEKFKHNDYGIPLPKPIDLSSSATTKSSHQNGNNGCGALSGAIIENSIVSSRGVQKTIIEANLDDDMVVDSDVATDVSMKSGKKGRAGSFWAHHSGL